MGTKPQDPASLKQRGSVHQIRCRQCDKECSAPKEKLDLDKNKVDKNATAYLNFVSLLNKIMNGLIVNMTK